MSVKGSHSGKVVVSVILSEELRISIYDAMRVSLVLGEHCVYLSIFAAINANSHRVIFSS